MTEKQILQIADTVFNSIVENAIEFITRASADLARGHLKYALLHFYSGAELLIKARLARDHWSLMLTKPEMASLEKLKSGDIHTVGLIDGLQRIQSLRNESIPQNVFTVFKLMRDHRNRLVHFFNADTDRFSPKAIQRRGDTLADGFGSVGKASEPPSIALELCVAWYYLHDLINNRWGEYFSDSTMNIDRAMLNMKPYLEAKYNAVSNQISLLKNDGHQVKRCPSCDYLSAVESDETASTSVKCFVCKVCHVHDNWIEITCQAEGCEGVHAVHEGFAEPCTDCEEEIDLDAVIDTLLPSYPPGYGEPGESYFCKCCDSFELGDTSVYPVPDSDFYFCLLCNSIFTSHDLSTCDWCGHLLAGSVSDTAWLGCGVCDGAAAKHS